MHLHMHLHMHMHVLLELCYRQSRHVCTRTERETRGNTGPIVLAHYSHIPYFLIGKKETMLLYLWTLYMGYNRVCR